MLLAHLPSTNAPKYPILLVVSVPTDKRDSRLMAWVPLEETVIVSTERARWQPLNQKRTTLILTHNPKRFIKPHT
jgi:hypothetical protein